MAEKPGSPVREIRTPGSEGGGRLKCHAGLTRAPRRKARTTVKLRQGYRMRPPSYLPDGTTTAPVASFSCRLTAIRAVHPSGSVHDGAKFGLMVRGDLSDSAPSVGVEVAAGRGVHS